MRIVTLIENTSNNHLLSEHGLSLYIEYDDKKVLIDSGASSKFIDNAKDLGIDLSMVDYAIITHNHYDHIGGLKDFLRFNKKAKVFIRSNAFNHKLFRKGEDNKDIKKLSYDWKEYTEYQDRFCLLDSEQELMNGVNILFIDNPNEKYICKDNELKKLVGGNYLPDDYQHELFVTFYYNDSIIIISSCSHNGAINIIENAKNKLKRPVSNFIGGLHMKGRDGLGSLNCKREFVELNGDYLDNNIEQNVYTGHCTGLMAYDILKGYLNDKLEYLPTGKVIEL